MDEQVNVLLVILVVVVIGWLIVHVIGTMAEIRRIDRCINGHEYVDLGLPSGLKWATCNVGADNATERGTCFAWGKTTPFSKDNPVQGSSLQMEVLEEKPLSDRFTIVTARFVTSPSDEDEEQPPNKENVNESIISGNASRDAARANWCGTWRMPTRAEMQELVEICSWQWVSLSAGIAGFMVTGASGRSVFLPGAANADDEGTDNNPDGCYWIGESSNCRGLAYMLKTGENLVSVGVGNTTCGFYVRPISE